MGQKNFGVAVSGYLDPTGRSFEQAVYQAGKPILDKELNLSDEIASAFGLDLTRMAASSGWITDQPLTNSVTLEGVFTPSITANLLVLSNNLRALVNGWIVNVQYTGNNAANQISLGAAPSGNAAKRTDLVILEVWRRLISPSPSTVGKSTGSRIWRNGNVKVPSANDAALNYADDILDATLNAESTKRVQIQYRLRAISGVDLFNYPAGIDDPTVVANSVPASAVAPDGVASAFNFSNQSSNGDPGLWRAGDGDPSNSLGTVDGYVYAIPLVAAFRRNSTVFNRNLNHNGGSSRPDSLTHDIFVQNDIADLRCATSVRGWDYTEVGEKNFGYLLDNLLCTEWGTTAQGGGVHGHTLLWADEIGVLPGDGTTTGDTPGAEFIGQFDCTRRFFSDRSNYEVMTFRMVPGDPNISTATWQAGTVVTINPAQIAQYPFTGAIGFISRAPSGTRIVDVKNIWIQGGSGAESVDVGQINAAAPAITQTAFPVDSITGLGVYPPGNVTITLGTPPAVGLTTEPIFIDLLIAYPPGVGLSRTPTADFASASFSPNNAGALPAGAPTSFGSNLVAAINYVNREAHMQYQTSALSYTFTANSTGTGSKYTLPERVHSLTSVTVNASPVGGCTVDASGRILTIPGGAQSDGNTIVVNYIARRAYPQTGFQMTVYYQARAAQTVRSDLLGTSATLVPRWISSALYTLTAGSGSQAEAYPYPYAYVQTGGVLKTGGTFAGEHELDGAVDISVAEFNASTGFLKLPTFIPYVPSPEEVTFTRAPSDTDIEDRTFFPTVAAGYVPNAFAQGFSNERVHKVVLPTLMENSVDTDLGPKGALFLVLFTRWAAFDDENSVKFLTSSNTTTASIFRVSGNLLNRRS